MAVVRLDRFTADPATTDHAAELTDVVDER
jgi:hypothetical protein